MKINDEFSMSKTGLRTSNSMNNILSINLRKDNNRNNIVYKIFKNRGNNPIKSLPKIKYNQLYNEKYLEKQRQRNNFNNANNSSNLINYCDKKKHLSFYNGSSISISSIFLDTTKTISTDMKSTSGTISNIFNFKKTYNHNFSNTNFTNNLNEHTNENKEKKNIKDKFEKNNINKNNQPFLDLSQLSYKPNITSLRNRYSLLFNKEFEHFDKFIPSLYALRFEKETNFILSQLHTKILSSIKYLSGIFLDQDIETFKITVNNLEKILTNLLYLFIYNNKINKILIKNTKQIMNDLNREAQNKKEPMDKDINTEINKLKKKLEEKNDLIKQIKNEKFKEHNEYIINMKKLKDEQFDLVKLLKKNVDYFNKYQDSQKELKEKNNIITQQRIDYKEMMDKNFIEIVKLKEERKELKNFVDPVQEQNIMIKDKNKELEEKLSVVDIVTNKRNQIINKLNENLMMKNEELLYYINKVDILKEKNEQLSYDIIGLKNKYKSYNNNKFGFNDFDYNGEILDD